MNLVESYIAVHGGSTTRVARRLAQLTGKQERPGRIYQYYYGQRRIPYDEWPIMTREVAEHFGKDLEPHQLVPPEYRGN